MESVWFFVYDSVSYLIEKLWSGLVILLCIPMALLGLIFEKIGHVVKMVSRVNLICLVSKQQV